MDQKPLHLANGYLHGLIRSSLTGDSHTAMSALYFLDIAYGAEPERRVNDVKIMPAKPTKQTPDYRWYFWHDLTARNKVDAGDVLVLISTVNCRLSPMLVHETDYDPPPCEPRPKPSIISESQASHQIGQFFETVGAIPGMSAFLNNGHSN